MTVLGVGHRVVVLDASGLVGCYGHITEVHPRGALVRLAGHIKGEIPDFAMQIIKDYPDGILPFLNHELDVVD